jgi:hypothetical protein
MVIESPDVVAVAFADMVITVPVAEMVTGLLEVAVASTDIVIVPDPIAVITAPFGIFKPDIG